MKKENVMKWIILLSVVLFAASCSNDAMDVKSSNSSVKVDIKSAEMNGSGTKAYKRGQAPVYISGITLTATNKEYGSNYNKTQTFNFKSDKSNDGDDIVMTGLYVGRTNFSGVGICNNPAANNYYDNLAGAGIADVNDAAAAYEASLRKAQPIYANYYSLNTKDVVISNNSSNNITLNMDSESHRVAIILENPSDSKYDLKWKVNHVSTELLPWSNFINANEQEALVINNEKAMASKTYTVQVKYFTKDTREPMVDGNGDPIVITKTIEATKLDNITKLLRFKKGDLLIGSATTTISWETKDPTIGGEDIE